MDIDKIIKIREQIRIGDNYLGWIQNNIDRGEVNPEHQLKKDYQNKITAALKADLKKLGG